MVALLLALEDDRVELLKARVEMLERRAAHLTYVADELVEYGLGPGQLLRVVVQHSLDDLLDAHDERQTMQIVALRLVDELRAEHRTQADAQIGVDEAKVGLVSHLLVVVVVACEIDVLDEASLFGVGVGVKCVGAADHHQHAAH